MVAPTGGNTIGAPPRLTGDPSRDTLALLTWVQELYQAVVLEANVLGTQRKTTADLAALAAQLGTEQSERTGGYATLAAAILAEAAARTADDATIVAAITAAISSEAAARRAQPDDIFWFVAGTLTGGQTILRLPLARATTFPAGLTGSLVVAGVAATAAKVLSIQKNGVEFATASVAIGGTVATLAAASATSFNGTTDILSIIGPAVADATLADLGINLLAAR